MANLIDLSFDISKFDPSTQKVVEGLKEVLALADQIANTKISPQMAGSGWGELKNSMQALSKSVTELNETYSRLNTINQTVSTGVRQSTIDIKKSADVTLELDRNKKKLNETSLAELTQLQLTKKQIQEELEVAKMKADIENSVEGSRQHAIASITYLKYQQEILNTTTEAGTKKYLELGVAIEKYQAIANRTNISTQASTSVSAQISNPASSTASTNESVKATKELTQSQVQLAESQKQVTVATQQQSNALSENAGKATESTQELVSAQQQESDQTIKQKENIIQTQEAFVGYIHTLDDIRQKWIASNKEAQDLVSKIDQLQQEMDKLGASNTVDAAKMGEYRQALQETKGELQRLVPSTIQLKDAQRQQGETAQEAAAKTTAANDELIAKQKESATAQNEITDSNKSVADSTKQIDEANKQVVTSIDQVIQKTEELKNVQDQKPSGNVVGGQPAIQTASTFMGQTIPNSEKTNEQIQKMIAGEKNLTDATKQAEEENLAFGNSFRILGDQFKESSAATGRYGLTLESLSSFQKLYDDMIGPVTDKINTNKEAIAGLEIEQQKLVEEYNNGAISIQEYKTLNNAITESLAKTKQESKDLDTILNNLAKGFNGGAGSVAEMEAELTVLQRTYVKLQDTDQQGNFGKNVQEKADQLSNTINQQRTSIGDFTKNVGRYAQSLAPLFADVTGELQRLKKEQEDLSNLKTTNPAGFATRGGDEALNRTTQAYNELEQIQKVVLDTNAKVPASLEKTAQAFSQLTSSGVQDEKFLADFKGKVDQFNQSLQNTGNLKADHQNYTESLNILKASLSDAKGRLQQLTEAQQQNTAAGKDAAAEVELLTTLVGSQDQGFASLYREVFNLMHTTETLHQRLQALRDDGQQGSATYQNLSNTLTRVNKEYANARRSLDEFRAGQNILTSAAPKLTALTSAAKGLSGIYATGAGAAALFADGNEKVAEKLNKLVAVMTLLQGLNEINRLLMEKDAIATALFGDETEKSAIDVDKETVSKEINTKATEENIIAKKTETAQTIQNSAALKSNIVSTEESAAANQLLSTSSFGVVSAIESVGVASAESGAALEANAVALETQTVGAVELTAANTALAASEVEVSAGAETAAASTGILSRALAFLAANPIVAALGALAAAYITIIALEKDEETQLIKNVDASKKYSDGIKSLNETILARSDAFSIGLKNDLRLLEEKLGKQTKEGANEATLLKTNDEILKKKKEISDADIIRLGKDKDLQKAAENLTKEISKQNGEYVANLIPLEHHKERLNELLKLQREGTKFIVRGPEEPKAKFLESDQIGITAAIKHQEELIKSYQGAADAAKASSDELTAAKQKGQQNDQALAEHALATQKYYTDEQRKDALDLAQFQLNTTKNKNDLILQDERSTFAQRIAAEQSNIEAQKKFALAELNNVLSDKSKRGTAEESIARRKYWEQVGGIDRDGKRVQGEIEKDGNAKIEQEVRAYELRIMQIRHDANAIMIAEEQKAQQEIFSDASFGPDKRMEAYAKYYLSRRNQITDDFEFEKQQQHLQDADLIGADEEKHAQLLALNKKYDEQIIELARDTKKEVSDIIVSSLDDEISLEQLKIKLAGSKQKADINVKQNTSGTPLLEKRRLAEESRKIDTDTAKQEINLAIGKDSAILASDFTTNAQKKVAARDLMEQQAALYLLDAQNKAKAEQDKAQAVKAEHALEKELADDAINFIESLFTNSITRQKNAVQDLENLQQKHYEQEVTRVQNSTLSEQDKAARLIQLEAGRNAQKEQNDRRQKELDIKKAKFEKAFSIGHIIEEIAMREVEALSYLANVFTAPFYPAIAALIGSVGAVQLATAIATPIPTYAQGVGVEQFEKEVGVSGFMSSKKAAHPGGKMIVGDGGRQEAIRYPDGSIAITPDHPVLTEAPAGTIVHPDANKIIERLEGFEKLTNYRSAEIPRYFKGVGDFNSLKIVVPPIINEKLDIPQFNVPKIVPFTIDTINDAMYGSVVERTSERLQLMEALESKAFKKHGEDLKRQTEELKKAFEAGSKKINKNIVNIQIDLDHARWVQKNIFGKDS